MKTTFPPEKDWQCDLYRLTGRTDTAAFLSTFLGNRAFRRLWYYRRYRRAGRVGRLLLSFCGRRLSRHLSVELPWPAEVGRGLLLLHPTGITFQSKCRVGENCTILKGVTIGNAKTGRPGSPTIGNNVYIGMNSSVVGGVTIGNDVMIAPNTFVNFDVPDGMLVLGSPGQIHKKEKASAPYTIHSIEVDSAAAR